MEKQKNLIIIDGNALMHRSFHAIPPLTLKTGEIVNAVYGFTSFLIKSLAAFKPDYIALTFDKKAPTFRHEAYTEYKATRTKAPDELYTQFPLVKEVAIAFDIPIFELDSYEADDLIGTLSKQAGKEGLNSIIITGDLDTLQLIDDNTKVYTMSRGLSDSVLYDAKAVEERYGLKPEQMIDYKGLRGDASDNIPGVKGIGEKTASTLLQEFGNLDKVIEAAKDNNPSIKPRIAKLISEQEETARMSKELATINCQAPIEIDWEKIIFSPLDEDKIIKVLQRFEFNSLLNRFNELSKSLSNGKSTPEKQTKNDEFKCEIIDNGKKFSAFIKKLSSQKWFAFDFETDSLDTASAKLLSLAFSWENHDSHVLDLRSEESNTWIEELKPIFEDKEIGKIGHNLKFEIKLLSARNIKLAGELFDTLIASYLLHPEERQHSLDKLSLREFGYQKTSKEDLGIKGDDGDFSKIEKAILLPYNGEDAAICWQAKSVLEKELEGRNLIKLFQETEMPLVSILAKMEETGIMIDKKLLSELEKRLTKEKAKLEKEIYEIADEKFNISSPKQLQKILFEKLDISTFGIKRTKTGISTAEEELQKLSSLHPIIPMIQQYRETSKLLSTYISPLPKIADKDGVIHTNFQQAVVSTGRLSSTDPNLQNIPTRTEEGKLIRSAFIARPKTILLSFDYSQIELRLTAHISGDQKMIDAFIDGDDIHRITAAEINGVEEGEVTPSMRREAKAINFGILYGQGAHGLSQSAGIPYARAKDFIAAYFKSYPKIREMVDGFIKSAKENGYVETMFGRRRYIPEINSPSGIIRRAGERMAINTPIQGSAADLIKKAMVGIEKNILKEHNDIKLLLQIHDELIFEVEKGKENQYIEKIKEIMENTIKIAVPIKVELSMGSNWGELK